MGLLEEVKLLDCLFMRDCVRSMQFHPIILLSAELLNYYSMMPKSRFEYKMIFFWVHSQIFLVEVEIWGKWNEENYFVIFGLIDIIGDNFIDCVFLISNNREMESTQLQFRRKFININLSHQKPNQNNNALIYLI